MKGNSSRVYPGDADYPESAGDKVRQVYRLIENECWGDNPLLGKLVNMALCLPIGFVTPRIKLTRVRQLRGKNGKNR